MTVEQRQESVKQMKGMGENAKVSIRNDRKHANDQIKKTWKRQRNHSRWIKICSGQHSKKTTDKFITNIDGILKDKEAEILKV